MHADMEEHKCTSSLLEINAEDYIFQLCCFGENNFRQYIFYGTF